mmetsp:Transcript_18920/g.40817  ORF Transcript_18920/g.40817 Transcript_18920/m.40817 type:complete len:718 (-) Transcript_18920:432-2585(-)
MADRELRATCPCCAEREAKGILFRRPVSDELCGLCLDAPVVDGDSAPPDGDALLTSILACTPVKLRWDLSVQEVEALGSALIKRCNTLLDNAVSAHTDSAQAVTWAGVMQPLVEADAEFGVVESVCTFPGHVSADKAVRDACTAADTRLSAYAIESSARKDVYEAVLAFSETAEAKNLTGEKARCVQKKLLAFRRLGVHLEGEVASQVKGLLTRMSELGIQFSKNLGEEDESMELSEAELAGMPADYLRERKQPNGKFKVTLKYPCYVPLMEKCRVPETRRLMEAAFNSRCKQANGAILEELVSLRHQKAQLMGYASHAAFVLEDRMAKSAEAVGAFLSELARKLAPLLESDLAQLADLKKLDGVEGAITAYDRSYYCKRLEETKFKVDHEALKRYFPLQTVQAGLLGIYQELLGLTFTRNPDLEAAAWHSDVSAFTVSDTATAELVGYFYMDMHPRAGKYGHAACFGLQPGCVLGGRRIPPVAAMVCNFPKPTAESPALLTHRDVETFFHEFGHVMHQLCSTVELEMFAGTRVERDFVEAPSQMLENWCWKPEALARMSRHHETGEPIPDELLNALLASRTANAGILNMRQIVLATFDQRIHSVGEADTAAVLAEVTAELMRIPATPGTNMAASFGHMGGGYDAQYYGYMWSEVYSADMFASRFEAEGIFSAVAGSSYRHEILSRGGSRDAMESLVAFLGREPSQTPFLRAKGLEL